jgi:choline dehydrogenase-like flavoprotein
MIIDANTLRSGDSRSAQVVVIGAGAAGIPMAADLEKAGISVLLIETGGLRSDPETRDLSKGQVVGRHHGPLDHYRQRTLGGTTAVWGGRCAPFDPVDFEARAYVASSGWPITLGNLLPFYQQAHRYLGLGSFNYCSAQLEEGREDSGLTSFHNKMLWRFSQPIHLGKEWRKNFRESQKTTVILHATCVRLKLNESGNRVDACELRTVNIHVLGWMTA